MVVTVEGTITSVQVVAKENKLMTNLLLVQKGEKEQVAIRLDGDQSSLYEEMEKQTFTGRLMTWTTRNGIGSMVMCQ